MNRTTLIAAALLPALALAAEDPAAVVVRDDGVTVYKDLSHKWRGSFETPLRWENVDQENVREWFDGVEKGFDPPYEALYPLVRQGEGSAGSLDFGVSPKSGPRHVRYPLKEAIPVGTVFSAHGGIRPSVLKPDAPYPGDMADESQWISGIRILADGRGSREVDENELSFWAFPAGRRRARSALRKTSPSRRAPRGRAGAAESSTASTCSPSASRTSPASPPTGRRATSANCPRWSTAA